MDADRGFRVYRVWRDCGRFQGLDFSDFGLKPHWSDEEFMRRCVLV